ncbi:fimbrial assembly protein [Oceanimonas sp. CHS3-5]|uniref:fimbrial assembly protein n=1 Tax=Oceanimonas sp. CHS3-5 TaxID=3068186 RepID=UPI00273DD941|nr:fimbrial assembly protein [Oceanimonas sp. CHS3-5]MDP5291762.1 fimbrial assembly protein [Oceanimonas sp. CHS3-5]
MKTRIEFYQAALKPVRDLPTLRQCGLGLVALVLLWGSVFAWQHLTNYQLHAANRGLEQQLAAARNNVAQLQQGLALLNQRQDDGERLRLERDIRTRRQLLGLLSQDELVSYADTLEDLARVPWSRVSLTGVQLQGRAMTLTGEASDAAAVPAWILGFDGRESLARREFGKLNIHRREPGGLSFSLHSEGVTQ